MAVFKVETKNKVDIDKKPRVYFTCHPDDFEKHFKKICEEIDNMNLELSEEDRRKADVINSQAEEILAEIRNENAKLRDMLVDRKDKCRDELKEIRENERGFNGYFNNGTSSGSMFFDRKG